MLKEKLPRAAAKSKPIRITQLQKVSKEGWATEAFSREPFILVRGGVYRLTDRCMFQNRLLLRWLLLEENPRNGW